MKSADTKEKDLMLDKDMEKDTWNFKSVTDDDPMDFGFESPAKNKKNVFKMDMSFDLDGDFGKLPSFKMDMPDFDFSSPAKKTAKNKESSDDKSSGNARQKNNLFAFDFDALDDFDFGSSPPKKGSETASKTMDCDKSRARKKTDRLDALDFGLDLPITKEAASMVNIDVKEKHLAEKENHISKTTDNMVVDNSAHTKQATLDSMENSETKESPQGLRIKPSRAHTMCLPAQSVNTSPLKTSSTARRKTDKLDALDFGVDLPVTREAASMENVDAKAKYSAGKENQISKITDSMVVDSSAHTKQATLDSMENSEMEESSQGSRIKSSQAQTMCFPAQSVNTSPLKTSSIARRKTDKLDALDFGVDLPVTREAASMENIDVKAKYSAEKENQISKTTDNMVVDSSAHTKQATLDSMENSETEESPQGSRIKSSQAHTMCLPAQSVNTSPLKTSNPSVKEIDEPCSSNEIEAPSPLYASGTEHVVVNKETSPNIYEICRSDPKEEIPRDPEQNASNKMVSIMKSSCKKTEQTASNISSHSGSDKIGDQQEEMDTGTKAQILDHTRRTLCDQDAVLPQTTLSGKISPNTRPNQTAQVRDSSANLELDRSHSVPGSSGLKTMQNKDSGVIRSRYFKKLEKPETHVLEPSPSRTEIQPVNRERTGLILNPTIDRSSDIEDPLSGSKTRRCPAELANKESEKNAADVNTSNSHEKIIHKDHSNAKAIESVHGLMDQLKLAKNTTREMSTLQKNISSTLNASSLTQKPRKHLSSGAELLQKSKVVPLERPKLGYIMSDLRSLKTQSRINEVNKGQPSSAVRPEASSSISKERHTEAPVKKSSKIHLLVPRDKTQILHCPSSLKRKALNEDGDRSLKPQPKRFSMSPRENRNVEELTHRVAQGKFSSQESRIDSTTKELVKESSGTKSHHHQTTNMENLETLITANTENIERAESLSKELDNICNILKKKHEEAKELLVRSVVNNNKLLTLNHPSLEEKIRMVQKMAAKLTLRDT